MNTTASAATKPKPTAESQLKFLQSIFCNTQDLNRNGEHFTDINFRRIFLRSLPVSDIVLSSVELTATTNRKPTLSILLTFKKWDDEEAHNKAISNFRRRIEVLYDCDVSISYRCPAIKEFNAKQ